MPLILYRQAEFKSADKQPNHKLMHLDRFGKADGLADQPLDTGPQGQMPALDLLGVSLARGVLVGIEMTGYRPKGQKTDAFSC